MNGRKGLVLDANILIRAVFGQRVRQILETYEGVAGFWSPDACFHDARKYIPDLSACRGFDASIGLSVLEKIGRIVESADQGLCMRTSKNLRERASLLGTRMTGQSSRWPSCSISQFGQRIRTSLEAASPPGPRAPSSYTCVDHDRDAIGRRVSNFGPCFFRRDAKQHSQTK
jgi:PIN domain